MLIALLTISILLQEAEHYITALLLEVEAFYSKPQEVKDETSKYLNEELNGVQDNFEL